MKCYKCKKELTEIEKEELYDGVYKCSKCGALNNK
jgi:DNA-directed RNA polymerase subunit RPC12/RpoP